MTDTISKERRSKIMAHISSKNTQPEMIVRKALHDLGYRYRLHRRDLPGSPDLVFPARRKIIFVHGCFWHGHHCRKGKRPSTNCGFWDRKLDRNIQRDAKNIEELRQTGWQVLVIWECGINASADWMEEAIEFLDRPR